MCPREIFCHDSFQSFPPLRQLTSTRCTLECFYCVGGRFLAAIPASRILRETHFAGLEPSARGKVRNIYDLGDKLLIVATDRLSAFDVILPTPIPDKGRVLTQLSLFWFNLFNDVIPNHVLSADHFPAPFDAYRHDLAGRSMIVRKTHPPPIAPLSAGPRGTPH